MNAPQTPTIRTAQELGLKLHDMTDINDLIGASFDLDGLILTEADLSPQFFQLHSGLAGEAFQKFTNYRVHVAVVLSDFTAYGERFAELAHEHAAHHLIRFVHSEAEARAWLERAAESG
ncbi:DUF4180 domain-containing protein [Deinococcus arenicola]|uniref:DUF4180 domain-containing protein n=1 Tax=Deinococcus arenicola TaxID=2994950 RepID=A0ABU4DN23_9DEIO|nr:DUF4180 domain-containing protein [Deinococcus sp. ZS9-10]MDV6373833.1 DUF4180 domain-containing protein [Deinococcus sp. ZS9-10]